MLLPLVAAIPTTSPVQSFGPNVVSDSVPVYSLKQLSPLSFKDIPLVALTSFSSIVQPDNLLVKTHYQSDNGIHHVYFVQQMNGLDIVNSVGNVNIDEYGQLLSASHTFYTRKHRKLFVQDASFEMDPVFTTTPTLDPADALSLLFAFIRPNTDLGTPSKILDLGTHHLAYHDKLGEIPIKLCYLTNSEKDDLDLVYDIVVDLQDNWYHAHVSAADGQLLSLVDWVSHSSYQVYEFGKNDPSDGNRTLVENPENHLASPLGWNTRIVRKRLVQYNTTFGNNVYAQSNPDGGDEYLNNHRPDGGPDLDFDFPLDLNDQPSTYIDAAITNLFYWCNTIHDLFYLYGFNEVAGNFQDYNFQRGGKGNDAVIANAQDGSGMNNANFATPPDGSHGRMRMYTWNNDPDRDGDLESGIIIHEYAHGISIRLTGGPDNSGCLGWGESGGMGEGWGDTFATMLRQQAGNTRKTDFGMGEYAAGRGIRKFPYSTNLTTNPSTYGFIRKPGYWGVHAKGEVWAAILYEVYWNLVDKHGFDDDWFDVPIAFTEKKPKKGPRAPKAGNKLTLRLLVDGLKLQPCYPTFVDARDAILLADQIATGGENQCDLWKAFAKRGLGHEARSGGHEDFTLPKGCVKA